MREQSHTEQLGMQQLDMQQLGMQELGVQQLGGWRSTLEGRGRRARRGVLQRRAKDGLPRA